MLKIHSPLRLLPPLCVLLSVGLRAQSSASSTSTFPPPATAVVVGTPTYGQSLQWLSALGTLSFSGSGLNDATYSGTYNGNSTITYCAQIDAAGTPDTFKWGTNAACSNGATVISVTGSAQTLSNGLSITFAATTGHTLNDKWSVTATNSWTATAAAGGSVTIFSPGTLSWISVANPTSTPTLSPTTGQTSHQVIGTCGSGTTFVPCILALADLSTKAAYQVSFQPGLMTAVIGTTGVYGKISQASTVDNLTGSAISFTCGTNPTITLFECGTSATCAAPTTVGTVTVTASGQAFTGTVSNPAITAGDYIGWGVTAGVCTSLDLSATAQVHTN